ncbi:hypothetical protein H8K33_13095 [Undibacterium amnicola]|uniref:Uncharacterized protein n=1 Tax=Undibacterium amnicola TaxID=1834038 RepID=A0ABR6XSF4_9BURK|nr:hypothetical protein [Undibacterium amnicola]MBC3832436.1 hypothetical protein [Undibacterium amnicola]
MKSFRQFNTDLERQNAISKLPLVLEHETYKQIPGTKASYRQDAANTNTMTDKHAHVYAKKNGGGQELYSVNFNGKGHDGYSGTPISSSHADYFRSLGYNIPATNVLESLDSSEALAGIHTLMFLEDLVG